MDFETHCSFGMLISILSLFEPLMNKVSSSPPTKNTYTIYILSCTVCTYVVLLTRRTYIVLDFVPLFFSLYKAAFSETIKSKYGRSTVCHASYNKLRYKSKQIGTNVCKGNILVQKRRQQKSVGLFHPNITILHGY